MGRIDSWQLPARPIRVRLGRQDSYHADVCPDFVLRGSPRADAGAGSCGKGRKELLERGSRLFPVQVLQQGGRFQGHRLSQAEKKGRA